MPPPRFAALSRQNLPPFADSEKKPRRSRIGLVERLRPTVVGETFPPSMGSIPLGGSPFTRPNYRRLTPPLPA